MVHEISLSAGTWYVRIKKKTRALITFLVGKQRGYILLSLSYCILVSCIAQNFIDIKCRHATRVGGGGEGGHSLPIFGNQDSALILEKNGPGFTHFGVKFSIQKFYIFTCGAFFVALLTKCLLICPNSTKPLLPWNISGCAPEVE